MIESHCNPDAAWSDAAQQITPEVLAEMLEIYKSETLIFQDLMKKWANTEL